MDTLAEQYIQLPLALANSDGTPLKGQKSYATKALKNRYKNSTPPVILNCLLSGWTPECCILEGMFMLNTQPLGTQRTFSDYGNFLIKRYILPHFSSGTREVHVILDSPGRLQQTPKYFERLRRDSTAPVNSNHTCDDFTSKHPIPSKWREGVINCRICKRNLVLYLTQFFLQQVPKYLQPGKRFLVAGGFEGAIEDSAWFVTAGSKPEPNPHYSCNAEETDTRLWLHIRKSPCSKILIRSPDTDIYHILLVYQYTTRTPKISLYR